MGRLLASILIGYGYILRQMILISRRSPSTIHTPHQVFDCARPLDENVLFPGSMLYGKAERNPRGVNSNGNANDGIAYLISAIIECRSGCKSSHLLAQPAAARAPVDHIEVAHQTRSFHCLLHI